MSGLIGLSALADDARAAIGTGGGGSYVPLWQPNTAYTSGQFVLNPSGQIVSANTSFTSGPSYNASSWTVVSGDSGNGLPSTYVSRTTAYTASAGDAVEADVSGGGFTVTLPASPAIGALVSVKKVDASGNTLTIAPSGGGTIDGQANATTTTQWAGAVFEHKGSNAWRITATMSVTGPQGPTGATGATGPAGPTGPTGAPGGGILPRKFQSGRYVTMPGVVTTLTLSDGYEFAFPIEVFESTTFSKIGINLGAVNGTAVIRLGVRQDASGLPGTLVAEAASTIDASSATGTAGNKELNFTQTLAAGIYWLVLRCNGGTTVQVTATNNMPVIISATTTAGAMTNQCSGYENGGGVTGALAASWTATYNHTVTVPRIVLKTA